MNIIKHMNYVYTVYQEKSFTRAAEKLFISQPSLSLTIKRLEREVGCPIFERRGREIVPTVIGEKYIRAIEAILNIQNNLKNEIDDIMNLKKGSIRIGSTTFIASYILPELLGRFREKYPNVDISLLVEQSTVLEEKLQSDEVDIIIDNATHESVENKYIPLFEERILIGVPKSTPQAARLAECKISKESISDRGFNWDSAPKVAVSEFDKEKFILLKKGNKMRQIADDAFETYGVSPEIVMEFDQLQTSISYADSGFGICFLSDTSLRCGKAPENLNIYIPKIKNTTRTLYVIHKRNRYQTAAVSEFVKFIREYF